MKNLFKFNNEILSDDKNIPTFEMSKGISTWKPCTKDHIKKLKKNGNLSIDALYIGENNRTYEIMFQSHIEKVVVSNNQTLPFASIAVCFNSSNTSDEHPFAPEILIKIGDEVYETKRFWDSDYSETYRDSTNFIYKKQGKPEYYDNFILPFEQLANVEIIFNPENSEYYDNSLES